MTNFAKQVTGIDKAAVTASPWSNNWSELNLLPRPMNERRRRLYGGSEGSVRILWR